MINHSVCKKPVSEGVRKYYEPHIVASVCVYACECGCGIVETAYAEYFSFFYIEVYEGAEPAVVYCTYNTYQRDYLRDRVMTIPYMILYGLAILMAVVSVIRLIKVWPLQTRSHSHACIHTRTHTHTHTRTHAHSITFVSYTFFSQNNQTQKTHVYRIISTNINIIQYFTYHHEGDMSFICSFFAR